MQQEFYMFIMDVFLIFMLGACIWYCRIIEKRISELNKSKKEFANMIKELNLIVNKAEANIGDLEHLSKDATNKIYKELEKAQFTLNDLNLLNDTGNNIADRLEKYITEGRKVAKDLEPQIKAIPAQRNDSSQPVANIKKDIQSLISRIAEARNKKEKGEKEEDKSNVSYFNINHKIG